MHLSRTLAHINMPCGLLMIFIFLATHSFTQNLEYKFSIDIENNTDTTYGYQLHSWDFSRIGRYNKALSFWDKDHNSDYILTGKDSLNFLKYKPVNAIKYILSLADTSQIIMLNEAHHNNLHRQFTMQLLKKLYNKGFRYLGLEALSKNDSTINDRKYPTQSSGFYIKEPVFGNFIRSAIEIGYFVFGYEANGKSGKDREIGQAKNIKQFIDDHPPAGVLIHAGFGHIREGLDIGNWGKAMAGRVKEFTGINPLTIDQVLMSERSSFIKENPIYRIASISESSIFINSSEQSFIDGHNNKTFDLQVFHPKTKYRFDRATWLFDSNTKYYPITLNNIEITLPCLVFAYKKSEYESHKIENLIPIDIVELDKENSSKTGFILPKGKFILVYKDKINKLIESEIEIE